MSMPNVMLLVEYNFLELLRADIKYDATRLHNIN